MGLITIVYLGISALEIHLSRFMSANIHEGVNTALGISYLIAFILMAVVNLYLVVQMETMSDLLGENSAFFAKEKRSLMITFIVFDLGYLARFIWDTWYFWTESNSFAWWVIGIFIRMTDVFFLLLLVLLHRQSFIKHDPARPKLHLSPLSTRHGDN